ncbi:MAG: Ig-like domain-containing protein [Gemmatimonadota bacterium]
MRLSTGLAATLLLAACAHIVPPPGGPEDRLAPVLTSTTPDSVASLPGFKGSVEFWFDEVVSEGQQPNFGLGTGTLEKLILLSPALEVPNVKWRRSRLVVSPRGGWLPNTTYRVELLPGIQDLRNNTLKHGAVVTFTTGTELPTDTLRGRAVDWTTSRPAPGALVIAVLEPDSLAYRTTADSTGRFVLGPLPHGEYLVYAVLDQNRNLRQDLRESFDSLRVAAGRDSVGELWAFRHDSTAARIRDLGVADSVTITAGFTVHLDPTQRLDPDSVQVLALPDSVPLVVLGALPTEAFDSAFPPAPPKRDTTAVDTLAVPPPADTAATRPRTRLTGPRAPARDTTDMAPLTTRPKLSDQLRIRVAEPLASEGRYLVRLLGLRTVSGVEGPANLSLIAPIRRPPPATPDTTAVSDSTQPPPPTTPPPVR